MGQRPGAPGSNDGDLVEDLRRVAEKTGGKLDATNCLGSEVRGRHTVDELKVERIDVAGGPGEKNEDHLLGGVLCFDSGHRMGRRQRPWAGEEGA